MAPSYYSSAYGFHEIETEEDLEFFRHVVDSSVEKRCNRCGNKVKLPPHLGTCNSCAEKLEQGFDLEFVEVEPDLGEQLEEARREIDQLKRENRELRDALGEPSRSGEG